MDTGSVVHFGCIVRMEWKNSGEMKNHMIRLRFFGELLASLCYYHAQLRISMCSSTHGGKCSVGEIVDKKVTSLMLSPSLTQLMHR